MVFSERYRGIKKVGAAESETVKKRIILYSRFFWNNWFRNERAIRIVRRTNVVLLSLNLFGIVEKKLRDTFNIDIILLEFNL